MEQFTEGESTREEIKDKLRQNFDGKIVRKDLTKKIKEGANVPVYRNGRGVYHSHGKPGRLDVYLYPVVGFAQTLLFAINIVGG